MKNILIAGAGIGGTIVANRLAEKLRQEVEKEEVSITIFDKNEKHVFQPSQLLVGMGLENPSEIVRNEKELLNPRVKFISGKDGEIAKIDVSNHSFVTAGGKNYSYDCHHKHRLDSGLGYDTRPERRNACCLGDGRSYQNKRSNKELHRRDNCIQCCEATSQVPCRPS